MEAGGATNAAIGAGAVGGFCGSKLAHAGHDLHFLFRSDSAYVLSDAMEIRSVDGDHTPVDVSTHTDMSTIPPSEVVAALVGLHPYGRRTEYWPEAEVSWTL